MINKDRSVVCTQVHIPGKGLELDSQQIDQGQILLMADTSAIDNVRFYRIVFADKLMGMRCGYSIWIRKILKNNNMTLPSMVFHDLLETQALVLICPHIFAV